MFIEMTSLNMKTLTYNLLIEIQIQLPLQKTSALFTATNDVDKTYDAYERDIAIVTFYFKNPTVFEYIR